MRFLDKRFMGTVTSPTTNTRESPLVKRWEAAEFDMVLDETGAGEYVLYSDYVALQQMMSLTERSAVELGIANRYGSLLDALREALEGWEKHAWTSDSGLSPSEQDRVSQLRSLYLRGEKD